MQYESVSSPKIWTKVALIPRRGSGCTNISCNFSKVILVLLISSDYFGNCVHCLKHLRAEFKKDVFGKNLKCFQCETIVSYTAATTKYNRQNGE